MTKFIKVTRVDIKAKFKFEKSFYLSINSIIAFHDGFTKDDNITPITIMYLRDTLDFAYYGNFIFVSETAKQIYEQINKRR